NPFVDSSREMNVPARLALGERLYRDVVYHYGPAGPWIDALAIEILGRRFAALEILGLLAAILLFYSLFRLTERAGSRLSACLAVTWAAALCVGAPNGGSFLFPYSFDALFALAGGFWSLEASAAPLSRARVALFSPPEEWRNVYRIMSGLAAPRESLESAATSLFLDLIIVGIAFVASRFASRPFGLGELSWVIALAGVTAFFGFGPGTSLEDRLPPLLLPLPLVSAAAALALLRTPLDGAGRSRWLLFGFSSIVSVRVLLGLRY